MDNTGLTQNNEPGLKQCKYYQMNGECRLGEKCNQAHITPQIKGIPSSLPPNNVYNPDTDNFTNNFLAQNMQDQSTMLNPSASNMQNMNVNPQTDMNLMFNKNLDNGNFF